MPAGDAGRRVRVVQVIARLNVGGPAVQVAELAAGLDPDRFDVAVLCGTVEPDEADYLELHGIDLPVVRVPGLSRSVRAGRDGRALAELAGALRRLRPDIVHTHTAKAGTLGRLAARTAGVAHTVHTFHGHVLHGYFSPGAVRAVVAVERALARRTTRLVAVGAQVRDDLLAAGIGVPGQYEVLAPGVRPPEPISRSAARAALGLPADDHVVALVARLTAVKRPDRFLAAAKALVASRPPGPIFLIAGAGPLLDELRRKAAPLGDRVRFLGWTADVATVYAAADVVALTSDNEGMPLSLVEAAWCGRPAVTTAAGSAGEVVLDGVTGMVTTTRPERFAQALACLLDDGELRSRLGAQAAKHAKQRFGVDTLLAGTGRMYDEVLAGGR